MFTDDQLKQLRQLLEANNETLRKEMREEMGRTIREEMERTIEDKIRPLVREEVHASANLLREDMKAGNEKVIKELTKIHLDFEKERDEQYTKLNERVTHLEEHTGLAKQN